MKSLAYILVFLLIGACGGQGGDAPLPKPNSDSAGATNAFPGVARIRTNSGSCSGVSVSPRAVLTASHCVQKSNSAIVSLEGKTFHTQSIERFGPGIVGDPKDIALLIFKDSENLATTYYSISNSINVGETVHVVGFGCGNANALDLGVKRAGSNVLYRIEDYLEILTPHVSQKVTRILGPSNRAGSCAGDSGGPMFVRHVGQFELVGIDHAVIEEGTDQISAYINLLDTANREFLRTKNQSYSLQMSGLN